MIGYILIAGVDNVGESVRGLFSSIAKARRAALSVPHSSDKTTWKEVAENYWRAADEYLLVEDWTLDENIFEGLSELPQKMNVSRPRLFQDSFDFEDTFEKKVAVDTISDMDLFAIWQAQSLEREL
jgi:hypothetical protein